MNNKLSKIKIIQIIILLSFAALSVFIAKKYDNDSVMFIGLALTLTLIQLLLSLEQKG